MDLLAVLLAVLLGSLGFYFLILKKTRPSDGKSSAKASTHPVQRLPVTIVYTSQKGTSKEFAERLKIKLEDEYCQSTKKDYYSIALLDMKDYDPDSLAGEKFLIFVVSSYTNGAPPVTGSPFCSWLQDHSLDFRVQRDALTATSFSILGLGNRLYCSKGHYNLVAKNIDFWLKNIGARRATSTFLADERDGLLDTTFDNWAWEVCSALESTYNAIVKGQYQSLRSVEEARRFDGDLDDVQEPPEAAEGFDDEDSEAEAEQRKALPDLEDLSTVYTSEKISSKFRLPARNTEAELLNPRLRQSLGKQGYRLIGSHSGVKLCRWTKAMLRGRGGCYKHTFYGIKSYQCMEMTPSLACANKCVFCWRHHTNPVTREWRWKADEARWLLEESIANHVSLINTLKGVPGVVPERLEEARSIRHCALSLVGEPIIYPHINEYLSLLHEKRISTFMVTNAQFPDKIEDLNPVTQMYISIDAATKDSLQKIDRPLFTDFWERFLASIDALSRKGQRTVFRLTLVKDWNTDYITEYAKLVERGMPEFIEIKGVTYCGENNASDLTMKNVPYHHEVVAFCNALLGASDKLRQSYGISCEHEHSCCMLISHKKFFIDGRWNTWIDYDRFHSIVGKGKPFSSLDYCEPTPAWAVFGSAEKGFDPAEQRFMRKSKGPAQGGC